MEVVKTFTPELVATPWSAWAGVRGGGEDLMMYKNVAAIRDSQKIFYQQQEILQVSLECPKILRFL